MGRCVSKRVYFAFDYEDVVDFRANVVRKHNFTEGVENAGYFDASIWEEAKKKDPAALKKLIDAELKYTTVTAVLIGANTWQRRWVRYEIMKSIQQGNRVIGVHINNIRDKYRQAKPLGANPFENVGYIFSADGKTASPVEWDGHQQWVWYSDLEPYPTAERSLSERGPVIRVSKWAHCYDWDLQDGYNNFVSWIN
jgi:MTH538 TIR-like domain (DUF1863)